MKMRNSLLLFIVISFLACSTELPIKDFASHVFDASNGLISKSETSENEYFVQFIPKELMAYNESKGDRSIYNEIKKEFQGLEYYQISINKKGIIKDKDEMSFYYGYLFEKDIYQLDGLDTLRPSLYLLEQGINGVENLKLNIAFQEGSDNDRQIIINDKYGQPSRHLITEDAIRTIPQLKL